MIINRNANPPPDSSARRRRMILFVVLLGFALGFAALIIPRKSLFESEPTTEGRAAPASSVSQAATAAAEIKRGSELAHAICASCHLFPEPDLLDRFSWGFEVLPNMSLWLGLTKFDYEGHPGGQRLKDAHYFPSAPALPFEDWRAICSYYLDAAPVNPLPQAPHPPVKKMENQFSAINAVYRRPVPQTTLVKIDSAGHRIYVGDGNTNTLNVLNEAGKSIASIVLDSPPVSLTVKSNGIYATVIGSFSPSDEPEGNLTLLETPKQGTGTKSLVLEHLFRPTDVVFADLNKDGREDLVVCQYGNFFGRFSWYENLGPNRFQEHVLLDRPGAIKAYVYDFNHDGLPDIVVLMAQAREGIYLFLNQGNGNFTMKTIVEQPPSWGYSSFQLVDFNGDGNIDILATNGDNGDIVDYRPPFKRYHGVRIYLNDGKNNFKESFFYPLNGAYKALAADFNGDGKMDIAAISFFPDYEHSPEESFVYLENKGGNQFDAWSLGAAISGRWITMDVGDLDGDGRPDIVLGAYNRGPGTIPKLLAEQWEKKGASILILKNNYGMQAGSK